MAGGTEAWRLLLEGKKLFDVAVKENEAGSTAKARVSYGTAIATLERVLLVPSFDAGDTENAKTRARGLIEECRKRIQRLGGGVPSSRVSSAALSGAVSASSSGAHAIPPPDPAPRIVANPFPQEPSYPYPGLGSMSVERRAGGPDVGVGRMSRDGGEVALAFAAGARQKAEELELRAVQAERAGRLEEAAALRAGAARDLKAAEGVGIAVRGVVDPELRRRAVEDERRADELRIRASGIQSRPSGD